MRFYLSSDKIGSRAEELLEVLAGGNMRTAYIPNALDHATDLERRRKSEAGDIAGLTALGLAVDRLDLREYFGQAKALKKDLSGYGLIWVRGGNVFVLRQAMYLSGFDTVLPALLERKELVYGGYSAGASVLAPTLKGIDLVDDPDIHPYPESPATIWEGLGIIEYSIVPHFDSPHPESAAMVGVVQYLADHGIPYKTLRDGEVIIFSRERRYESVINESFRLPS